MREFLMIAAKPLKNKAQKTGMAVATYASKYNP